MHISTCFVHVTFLCRFNEDTGIGSVLDNNTDDHVDLRGKYMRFLKDRECKNGENHSTERDCRAKAPVHIAETRSVQVARHTEDFESNDSRHCVTLNSLSPPPKFAPSLQVSLFGGRNFS